MAESGATCIAYETVQRADGTLPILIPMSEIAGKMAIQSGSAYLEKVYGGRGILLSGVAGVQPAEVLILGGGNVGSNAAFAASGLGAHVTIVDNNLDHLRYLNQIMPNNVRTLMSSSYNIRDLLPATDLVVGAALVPGAKAPKLITRDMLTLMQPRSLLVDVAIDQGGCFETSRPTTHHDPVYEVDGILHYCVANMPGAVPHTSTIALNNVTFPYTLALCQCEIDGCIRVDPALRKGVNTYRGHITNREVADAFTMDYVPIETLIGE